MDEVGFDAAGVLNRLSCAAHPVDGHVVKDQGVVVGKIDRLVRDSGSAV